MNEEMKVVIPFMLTESTDWLVSPLAPKAQDYKFASRDKISAMISKENPRLVHQFFIVPCPAIALLTEIEGRKVVKKLGEQSTELSDYESEFEVLNEKKGKMQHLAN